MAKPRLIILVRHGQSEGNRNRDIHQTVPDHRVKLTSDGWHQAHDAGRRLRAMLRADDTLHFFTSPYRRTRETTEGILQTLTSDEPEPTPFKRNNIKVYEEPRLREQDFGNFQPCSAEMERMWQERADYGHFFYRIPNGESAADAYDRVSGFNESLWRQFGDDDFASVCVLVTHGLMSRVFLMKWYHFSVEYFEDLRNVNHCEFLIMRKQDDSGKYQLETKLRTWSELRRERAALLKQKEEAAAAASAAAAAAAVAVAAVREKDGKENKDLAKLEKSATTASTTTVASAVPLRRWGGCPNGCNHDKNFKIRSGFADLVKRDGTNIYPAAGGKENAAASAATTDATAAAATTATVAAASSTNVRRLLPAARRSKFAGYSDDDDGGDDGGGSSGSGSGSGTAATDATTVTPVTAAGATASTSTTTATATASAHSSSLLKPPHIDVARAREEIVSSPDATPSFITPEDRLRPFTPGAAPPKQFVHLGRDFGGTYSGHTSDADSSEDDRVRRRMARLKLSISGEGGGGDASAAVAPAAATATAAAASIASLTEAATASTASTAATTSASTPASASRTSSPACLSRKKRNKSMANRLGDAPHCSDCDCEHDADADEDEQDMDSALEEEREAAAGEASRALRKQQQHRGSSHTRMTKTSRANSRASKARKAVAAAASTSTLAGDVGSGSIDNDDETDVDLEMRRARAAESSIQGSVY